jgi:hypothetical protein
MHQFLKFVYFWNNTTCLGRSFRPSSGVQDCAYSNRHMSDRYCYLLASKDSQWPNEHIIFITTTRLPLYSARAGFFWQNITSPRSVSPPLQPRFGSLRLLSFPKAKIAVEREEICNCDGHTVRKLSERRLTADWLAPRESDCSPTYRKVSSDWLPSYIKATRPVLEIFKMAR